MNAVVGWEQDDGVCGYSGDYVDAELEYEMAVTLLKAGGVLVDVFMLGDMPDGDSIYVLRDEWWPTVESGKHAAERAANNDAAKKRAAPE